MYHANRKRYWTQPFAATLMYAVILIFLSFVIYSAVRRFNSSDLLFSTLLLIPAVFGGVAIISG